MPDTPFKLKPADAGKFALPAQLKAVVADRKSAAAQVHPSETFGRSGAAPADSDLRRLRQHVERMPLAVIECDRDLRATAWNQRAERMFGYSRAQAMGRNVVDLIVPESDRTLVEALYHSLLSQAGETSVNRNRTRDGRIITCEWFNTPLFDASGAVKGFASMAQDITARIEAE